MSNIHDLHQALLERWDRVPSEMRMKLVTSMISRRQIVIRQRGGYTQFSPGVVELSVELFDVFDYILKNGTSRQRSGKGAIRKRFQLQKTEVGKIKLTIRYLYHKNISNQ